MSAHFVCLNSSPGLLYVALYSHRGQATTRTATPEFLRRCLINPDLNGVSRRAVDVASGSDARTGDGKWKLSQCTSKEEGWDSITKLRQNQMKECLFFFFMVCLEIVRLLMISALQRTVTFVERCLLPNKITT